MITVSNALVEYYSELQKSSELCRRESSGKASAHSFSPSLELPELDDRLERFFSCSTIRVLELGLYGGRRLRLLDLTCNPRTRTSKTFASLLMVARAVAHIRATGESIMLVTPSSANKGSALRDAVSRAVECELVPAHKLRIASVVPTQGLRKLWSLPLSDTHKLRTLNPVFLAQTDDGRAVKELTRDFVGEYSGILEKRFGLRLWHTYDLDNYRMSDAIRAFVEARVLGYPEPPTVRVHAQAVSSAFGLLGHYHGRRVLKELLDHQCDSTPRWLLVQHLGTPDLVLNQLFGSFSRDNLPTYEEDPSSGLLVQRGAPWFPSTTFSLNEVIDSTFYSHEPATATLVKQIQEQNGGTGIVVSLHECLARYGDLRRRLAADGPVLPADPRELREWALVMVLTGVLGAIDRNLVPEGCEVLVHATGSYSARDYTALALEHSFPVARINQMLDVIVEGSQLD